MFYAKYLQAKSTLTDTRFCQFIKNRFTKIYPRTALRFIT